MSADMPRDMQSSTWRLAVGGCLLGSAMACAPMSKTPAMPTAVSTRFITSHPNRRRASLRADCILYGNYAVYRGGFKRGTPVSSVSVALQHRPQRVLTAAGAQWMSSGECVAKQLEKTFPMPLCRGLVVHGPLRKGETVMSAGIDLHFGVTALLIELQAQPIDHFLRRI